MTFAAAMMMMMIHSLCVPSACLHTYIDSPLQVAGEFQLGEKVSYSDHGLDEVYNEEESALFYTGPNGEPLMYTDVEPQVYRYDDLSITSFIP